jgi:hypothetical protein
MLETDDLLILTGGSHPDRFGLPAVGIAPEAIARSRADISMLVIHFRASQ